MKQMKAQFNRKDKNSYKDMKNNDYNNENDKL